jgi:hypothetical protein
MALNGDTAFPFQVHVVEDLRLQVLPFNSLGELQQAICQRAFAVVNVCNNTEIAYILHLLTLNLFLK